MGKSLQRENRSIRETGGTSGKEKRNVILILADMITPPLPYLCVPSDMEQERSLGSILAAAHVTENLIKRTACSIGRANICP